MRVLIHKNFSNKNGEKLTGRVADWWLASYSLPHKPHVAQLMTEYDAIRGREQFPPLTVRAVERWLHERRQERQWYVGRHGRSAYANKFGHYISRRRAHWFPNAYWTIDGSKLDWVHHDGAGPAARLKIDLVFDVYSEKIIGWSLSESETSSDHFKALKMAAQASGCRPYLLTYDRQSGHKMGAMSKLYDGLVARSGGTHYAHRAYAHNSPAEGLFSRFQKQAANRWWFSDKQSPVSARTLDSRPNVDFLKENTHRLRRKEDLLRAWEQTVIQWNESKHPRCEGSRWEAYEEAMPMREALDIPDLIALFWVVKEQPATYRRGGLLMRVGGKSYEYEVRDGNDRLDVDFRMKHVGEKFYVRYDPDFLTDYVQLLQQDAKGGWVLVAHALPKRQHEVVPALMGAGDKERWQADHGVRDQELTLAEESLRKVRERTGITPERLIEAQEWKIKTGGRLPKGERSHLEEDLAIHGL